LDGVGLHLASAPQFRGDILGLEQFPRQAWRVAGSEERRNGRRWARDGHVVPSDSMIGENRSAAVKPVGKVAYTSDGGDV
jgi:hypothetical protein